MGNRYSRIQEKIAKILNKSNRSDISSINSSFGENTTRNNNNNNNDSNNNNNNNNNNNQEESDEFKFISCDPLSHFQSPHYTLRHLWQSNYSAPVEEILSSSAVVLDAGCGFGAWLIDMAEKYQTTDFVGVGLNPNQFPSDKMPKNVKFAQANILCGLPFEDNQFDFVRLCYFANSFACCEWEPAVKELIRVTKSGGWVEFIEPDLTPINMGPEFTTLVNASKQLIGERSNVIERLELILHSTMENTQRDSKSFIIGQLGGEVGISHENSIKEYFTNNRSQFCKRLGISREEYDKLLNDVLNEFQTREVEVRFF